jgi:hypothetical protein
LYASAEEDRLVGQSLFLKQYQMLHLPTLLTKAFRMYDLSNQQSASRCSHKAFVHGFMFVQVGCDWFLSLHIPSSVEAEVVVGGGLFATSPFRPGYWVLHAARVTISHVAP